MSYDPNRTADIYAEVESAPTEGKQKPLADQERLASIRQRNIALSKETSVSTGFIKHADYYKNFAGPETSHWDFRHVCYLLNLLEEPKFGNLYNCLDEGRFDAQLAQWTRVRATDWKFSHGDPPNSATLAELKVALASRIRELKISPVLLMEWASSSIPIAELQAFWRLPFEEKMQRFKKESI
jgi:hypothetical protein